MHNFSAKKHSIVGLILIGVLVLGIIASHIFGFYLLHDSFAHTSYVWVILAMGLVVVVVVHLWKIHSRSTVRMTIGNASDIDVVSRNGLHWHPEITIYVKGMQQPIPQTGITNMDMSKLHALHNKMAARHMHDGPNEQGIIHLKFEGVVRKSDIMLGQVFKKWGKDFHSYGLNVKMLVNGKENTECEEYVMQDKDKIELRYE